MNERIKELAVRTGLDCDECAYLQDNIHTFAELIVKDCIGICEAYRGTDFGKAAECVGDTITRHFGVEE